MTARPLRWAALLLMAPLLGCAWQPRIHPYPSGLTIIRVDPSDIDRVCRTRVRDDGTPFKPWEHAAACYAEEPDVIYLQNNCVGAEALLHEWAHREGIDEPSKAGYDW